MIANDPFVAAFGSVPAGDEEALVAVVSAAVRAGFAIVLDKPGEKIPLCTLNTRDRKAADRDAQEAARAMGDARWQLRKHPCGLHHALTVESLGGDPTKVRTKVGQIIRRVAKEHGAMPNIGVELGRSHLLVVDVDTDAERLGWIDSWTKAQGVGSRVPGMTVKSPGKVDRDGEWVHKNGGHYWFALPDDVELPAGTGSYRAPEGWVAMWADHQVLVPPSRRAEGEYLLVGQLEDAPEWLLEQISTAVVERMKRAKERSELPDGTGDIDVWAASTPWADLLVPDGWEDTGLPDRCSCPIFTAPGAHASPKSATAHDVGCDRYDSSPGHAPLHVWTDNPPAFLLEAYQRTGSRTFTKLQYLAWRDHDGAPRGVLADLGLSHGGNVPEFPGFVAEAGAVTEKPYGPEDAARAEQEEVLERDPFAPAGAGDEEVAESAPEPESRTMADVIRGLMKSSAELDEIEEPEPLVDGFLDLDTIARVIGASGSGKTFVMLDMAACIATGRPWHGFGTREGLVVYMVAEGVRGFKRRLRAWEARYLEGKNIPPEKLLIMPVPVQATDREQWPAWRQVLADLKPVLVILDTQARVTVGVDENDNTQMGMFVERLEQVRRDTGACVLTVHHTGHAGEHGRGATAVLGALGAELRVVKPSKGFLRVETSKAKDTEEAEPLRFRLDPVELGEDAEGRPVGSVVPIPDGWEPGDPFQRPGAVGEGVTGLSSARDRLAAIVWHVFSHGDGATRAEARGLLVQGHPTYGKAGKTAVYTAWNDLMSQGVLVQQVNAAGALVQRWKLDPEEAARLGLASPRGPEEDAEDEVPQPQPEGPEDENGSQE